MPGMSHKDIEQPASRRLRDRIVDWLGAQGPSILTIYMCGAVALIAFVADALC
jgi:hypothetical protein